MPKKTNKKKSYSKSRAVSGHDSIAKYAKQYSFDLPKDYNTSTKKGGRIPIVNKLILRKLELAFAYDNTVEEACIYAGIYPSVYYAFLKKCPEFQEVVTQLRNIPTFLARNTIVAGVVTSQDSAMRYMEKKRKNEFSSKLEVAADIKQTHSIDEETEKKIDDVFALVERAALKVVDEYDGENEDNTDKGDLADDAE